MHLQNCRITSGQHYNERWKEITSTFGTNSRKSGQGENFACLLMHSHTPFMHCVFLPLCSTIIDFFVFVVVHYIFIACNIFVALRVLGILLFLLFLLLSLPLLFILFLLFFVVFIAEKSIVTFLDLK